jgi:hypothetical protein
MDNISALCEYLKQYIDLCEIHLADSDAKSVCMYRLSSLNSKYRGSIFEHQLKKKLMGADIWNEAEEHSWESSTHGRDLLC